MASYFMVIEISSLAPLLFTPYAQRELCKVIGLGVLVYIYIYSILHILTTVFPGTPTVEYQPIFHGVT